MKEALKDVSFVSFRRSVSICKIHVSNLYPSLKYCLFLLFSCSSFTFLLSFFPLIYSTIKAFPPVLRDRSLANYIRRGLKTPIYHTFGYTLLDEMRLCMPGTDICRYRESGCRNKNHASIAAAHTSIGGCYDYLREARGGAVMVLRKRLH